MSSTLQCVECLKVFDTQNKVPLVLKCGDSICMECLLNKLNTGYYICLYCQLTQSVSLSEIKDMPINKALLNYIEAINKPIYNKLPPTAYTNTQLKFNSSIDPKINAFMTSEDEMKCKRHSCNKPKYTYNNTIYEYCSINCYETDRKQFSSPIG